MLYPSINEIRKKADSSEETIQLIHADEYIKKNNVSLRNAVNNDLFNSSPDVSGIYELGTSAE